MKQMSLGYDLILTLDQTNSRLYHSMKQMSLGYDLILTLDQTN